MKHNTRYAFFRLTLLPVALAATVLLPATARTLAPVPQATLTIPTPPVVPTTLPFADEVTGRHLLYDTRTAYRQASGVSFTAQWTGGQGGIGEAVTPGRTGNETFTAATSSRKIAIVVDTLTAGGDHEIRRADSTGTEITTTHFFQAGTDTANARRTFARLTLDESAELPRALAQIQLDPVTRAAAFAIEPRAYVAGADATLWFAGYATTADGKHVSVVDQVESADMNNRGSNRRRICRYWIETESHRLRRFEIWDVNGDQPRNARRTRRRQPDGTTSVVETPAYPSTVNYRREDYTKVALSESAPAGPWTLAVPTNYVEKALPTVDLPAAKPLVSAEAFDPRALKLLDKWRTARERFVSLSTEINVADHDILRTAESRAPRGQQDSVLHYQLVYRRPGKARIAITTVKGGGFRRGAPINGAIVADGEQATWTPTDETSNTAAMRNPAALLETMNRLGVRADPFNALGLILAAPPETDNYAKLTYDGQTLIDGRFPVDSITFHATMDRRNGQSQTEYTMQVFLGSDSLPRWIRTRNITELNGRLERDQPPIQTTDIQYANLLTDSEPPSTAFLRPNH